MPMTSKPTTIEAYIATFPTSTQLILKEIDGTIMKAAPNAQRVISYGIPTYKINGKSIIHFAGYKNHIGLYATPEGHEQFAEQLSRYKQGKGSVQLPITEPMPLKLIEEIVNFRLKTLE
jgi:uncharacterized protein YdhG (YjbR/CyaY superfamily)